MFEATRALLDPVVTGEEEEFLRILPASSIARQALLVRAWSAAIHR